MVGKREEQQPEEKEAQKTVEILMIFLHLCDTSFSYSNVKTSTVSQQPSLAKFA